MNFTTREQIMAAAKQADSGFAGGPDDDGTMADSIVGIDAVERFYTIAFEAGRDELCQQLTTLKSDLFDVTDIATAQKEKEMDLYHLMRKAAQADKQRIITLEQQLAAAQSEIESAFREGFRSPATYNDTLVNDEDEEWEKYKGRMK